MILLDGKPTNAAEMSMLSGRDSKVARTTFEITCLEASVAGRIHSQTHHQPDIRLVGAAWCLVLTPVPWSAVGKGAETLRHLWEELFFYSLKLNNNKASP